MQVHDIQKSISLSGADVSATVENDMRVFADEMLQLQITQVIKHFAKSKQRSDTSRFYMLKDRTILEQMVASDCTER